MPEPASSSAIQRTFPPGSEWLTAKLYGGPATVERLLREVVPPLVDQAATSGADRWFFVRYDDPDHHLRLRLHGSTAAINEAVLPALLRTMGPLVEGTARRLQLDTYEREVERYGGPEAIEIAEWIFHADSDAVLEILARLDEGDSGEEERWRIALCGADRLLTDFGFGLEAKRAIAATLQRVYGQGQPVEKSLRAELAGRYRKVNRELAGLLFEGGAENGPLGPGLEILGERSQRIAPLIRELAMLEHAGRLGRPIANIVESFVHMHLNRLLRSAQRAQELVLYDFLERLYASALARRLAVAIP